MIGTRLATQRRHPVGGSRKVEVNNGESEEVEAIRAGIARYLRLHPLARDTVEGIRRWWLEPEGVIAMDLAIEAVLEHLVAEGELHVFLLPDGQRLYGSALRAE